MPKIPKVAAMPESGVLFEGILLVSQTQLREILNRSDIEHLSQADLVKVLSSMDEFISRLNAGVGILRAVAQDAVDRAHSNQVRYGRAVTDISSRRH